MDMDGTLLNKEDVISNKTKEALMVCQQQGIRVILASGRSRSRLRPYVEELELERYKGYLFEVNGLALYSLATQERIVFQQLETSQIHALFQFIKPLEVEIQGFLDEAVYAYIPESVYVHKRAYRKEMNLPEDYPWTGGAWKWVFDSRSGYPHVSYVEDESQFPAKLNKICLMHAPERMAEIYPVVLARFQNEFEIVRTCPRIIEITAKGITKGKRLAYFMQEHNIQPDEIIVFGDGENDVEMFDKVTYGVAMGNAMDYVKEKASFVTLANDEDGIPAFLKKLKLL